VRGRPVFVLTLFLPWYGTSSTNDQSSLGLTDGSQARLGDTASAWQTFPILRWILLAAAVAPFILVWIVMRRHDLDWKPGEVTMIVGLTAFVLVLCNGVILGRPGDSVEISLQWGLSDRPARVPGDDGRGVPAPAAPHGRQKASGRPVIVRAVLARPALGLRSCAAELPA